MQKIALIIASAVLACIPAIAQSDVPQSLNQTTATATSPTPASTYQCFVTFTSGSGPTLFSWCVTKNGNLVKLESPAGFEHIYEGSITEGYGICDLLTQDRYYDYAMIGESNNWNDSVITQPKGPNTFPLTITRTTHNGEWKLTQQFSENKIDRMVTIAMTLKNNVAIPKDAYLARFVDFDANSANGGDFQNWFDATADAVTAWNPGKHYASLLTNSPVTTHFNGVFFFNTYLDPCTNPSLKVPVYGDEAGYVTHVLSLPSLGSRTVTLQYTAH